MKIDRPFLFFAGKGHPAPTYKNDRAWKAFDLFIPMQKYRLTDRGRQALVSGEGGGE